jgi:hypothetical protein
MFPSTKTPCESVTQDTGRLLCGYQNKVCRQHLSDPSSYPEHFGDNGAPKSTFFGVEVVTAEIRQVIADPGPSSGPHLQERPAGGLHHVCGEIRLSVDARK